MKEEYRRAEEIREKQLSIYGTHVTDMVNVIDQLTKKIQSGERQIRERTGMDPVEHIKTRIKTETSMREKCQRMGIPETTENALNRIYDAIGLRVVCPFLDEVYLIRDFLVEQPDIKLVREKDYIKNVKPNGYRSLHLTVQWNGYYAEIQIRTISMDTWASLEHHIRYKKKIYANQKLIFDELKRCAEELASTDASMQTIRNMVYGEE